MGEVVQHVRTKFVSHTPFTISNMFVGSLFTLINAANKANFTIYVDNEPFTISQIISKFRLFCNINIIFHAIYVWAQNIEKEISPKFISRICLPTVRSKNQRAAVVDYGMSDSFILNRLSKCILLFPSESFWCLRGSRWGPGGASTVLNIYDHIQVNGFGHFRTPLVKKSNIFLADVH